MKIIKRLLIFLAVGATVILFLNPSIVSDLASDNRNTTEHSISAISAEIKRSIQKEFDNNDYYSDYEIKVEKVSLIETGENSYKAYVDIQYLNGKEETLSADVHVNNDQYFWEFPAGTFLFLLEDFQWGSFNYEEEEEDSDIDYYDALDRLKNDKHLYSESHKNVSISSEYTIVKLYYPAITPKKYKYAWVRLQVYVDSDGSVLSAFVENAHYNATDEFKHSCIAAILNSRFDRNTPNVIQVMYEYNSHNESVSEESPIKDDEIVVESERSPNAPEELNQTNRHIIGSIPRPIYPPDAQEGRVMIDVLVDPSGEVVSASYKEDGSTTIDSKLVDAAIQAALKAKFNPTDTKENQIERDCP